MQRGEVWWAALGKPVGSGFRRPVLVVQSDDFNKSATQIIATDKTRLLERTGRLSEPLLSQVEDGILLVLGLRPRLSS